MRERVRADVGSAGGSAFLPSPPSAPGSSPVTGPTRRLTARLSFTGPTLDPSTAEKQSQKPIAWARRFTSEPRFSRSASMGRPGNVSSGVNIHAMASRSS